MKALQTQNLWDEIIKKHFRFIIANNGVDKLRILVQTEWCNLIEDSANLEITPYAKENLKDYFPYLDSDMKNLVSNVFNCKGIKEISQKDFVISMAEEILNCYTDIRKSLMRKSEEMIVPPSNFYVALGAYVKERSKNFEPPLLRQERDSIISLVN